MPAEPDSQAPEGHGVLAVPGIAFALAVVFYASTAQSQGFSDSPLLARMISGPLPDIYYNALYMLLAWPLHQLVGLPLQWMPAESLRLLSAICAAAAVALLAGRLERRGVGRAAVVGWCALVALTPATWFFATTAEVHTLQLLGATVGVLLALRARAASGARKAAWIAAAAAAAVLAHLTSLLLLPALVLLGSFAEDERPRAPRGRSLRAWLSFSAVALAALLLLFAGDAPLIFKEFAVYFWKRFAEDKAYSAGEMLGFLRAELLVPSGLLLLALLPGLVAARDPRRRLVRHLLAATLLAAAPYVVVLPAWGIREQGAYYMSLYPLLVLLGAESLAALRREARATWTVPAALVLLALLQGAMAVRAIREHDRGLPAEAWAEAAAQLGVPTSYFLVAGLDRYWAVGPLCAGVADVRRDLELMPRRHRAEQAALTLGKAFERAAGAVKGAGPPLGPDVLVDADLLRDRADPLLQPFRDLLESAPVVLEPLPAGSADPLVYRLTPAPR